MLNQKRTEVLKYLENLKYQSVIERMIRNRLERIEISKDKEKCRTPHFCFKRLQIYKKNINHLEEIRKKRRGKSYKVNITIVIPRTDEEIKNLAKKASIYFSQGSEMYKTSFDMNINSSPIIEYYALLQIVKGVILLELDVETGSFFGAHGLVRKSNISPDIVHQTRIKTHGVFTALLIRCTQYLKQEDGTRIFAMDKYFYKYNPTLREMVNSRTLSSIPDAFIFTWMLSEIARYQPEKWKEICDGEESDWIVHINKFKEEILPDVIRSLITSHLE